MEATIRASSITATDIKAILSADIEREQAAIEVHLATRDILHKHNGKPITKRIASDLQKAHPGWDVRYETDYGMYHLRVGNDVHMLIGYDSLPVVDAVKYDEWDNCNGGAAVRRNAQRIDLARDQPALESLATTMNAYNLKVEELERKLDGYSNPSSHNIRRLLRPNDLWTSQDARRAK